MASRSGTVESMDSTGGQRVSEKTLRHKIFVADPIPKRRSVLTDDNKKYGPLSRYIVNDMTAATVPHSGWQIVAC